MGHALELSSLMADGVPLERLVLGFFTKKMNMRTLDVKYLEHGLSDM
jgi:hypothetical protein